MWSPRSNQWASFNPSVQPPTKQRPSQNLFNRGTLQNEFGPLKSTAQMGYIESSRILNNNRYAELGSELLCCICHNVLWKPVACVTCENAFCAGCIRTWINKQTSTFQVTCPFNCKFQEKRAPPILINLLSKLQIRCAYKPNGCREALTYDALEKHEEACQYEQTPCKLCGTPVSHRPQNNKHELRQCFKQMYESNPDQVQTQFMKLLDVVEANQKRIEVLENLFWVKTQKPQ